MTLTSEETADQIMYPVYCIDGPLKGYKFQVHKKILVMNIFETKYRILWGGGAQEFPYEYPTSLEIPEGYPQTFTAYPATHDQGVTDDPA